MASDELDLDELVDFNDPELVLRASMIGREDIVPASPTGLFPVPLARAAEKGNDLTEVGDSVNTAFGLIGNAMESTGFEVPFSRSPPCSGEVSSETGLGESV